MLIFIRTYLSSLKLCQLLVTAQQTLYGFDIFLLLEAGKGVQVVERLVENVGVVLVPSHLGAPFGQ